MFDALTKGRQEGVTAFQAEHVQKPLHGSLYAELVAELSAWRDILSALGLIGHDRNRYEGIGFGNLSARTNPLSAARGQRSFLVTGSQTGKRDHLESSDFARVTHYNWNLNVVHSEGLCPPSSESMTHGAVYDLVPSIRYVFHVHAPSIWRCRAHLKLPETAASIEYGTPEMAAAIASLARNTTFWEQRAFAMAGHLDGITTFGKTAEEAGGVAVHLLARSHQIIRRPQ